MAKTIKMTIPKTCMICRKNFMVEIEPEAYRRWMQGEHIQDVAPELTIDERELLISGICGKCFDDLFNEEEENE